MTQYYFVIILYFVSNMWLFVERNDKFYCFFPSWKKSEHWLGSALISFVKKTGTVVEISVPSFLCSLLIFLQWTPVRFDFWFLQIGKRYWNNTRFILYTSLVSPFSPFLLLPFTSWLVPSCHSLLIRSFKAASTFLCWSVKERSSLVAVVIFFVNHALESWIVNPTEQRRMVPAKSGAVWHSELATGDLWDSSPLHVRQSASSSNSPPTTTTTEETTIPPSTARPTSILSLLFLPKKPDFPDVIFDICHGTVEYGNQLSQR